MWLTRFACEYGWSGATYSDKEFAQSCFDVERRRFHSEVPKRLAGGYEVQRAMLVDDESSEVCDSFGNQEFIPFRPPLMSMCGQDTVFKPPCSRCKQGIWNGFRYSIVEGRTVCRRCLEPDLPERLVSMEGTHNYNDLTAARKEARRETRRRNKESK